MKITWGPMNAPSATSTPSYSEALFCTFTLSPTMTSRSMKQFRPMLQFRPIRAPIRTWTLDQMRVSAPISVPGSILAVGWICGRRSAAPSMLMALTLVRELLARRPDPVLQVQLGSELRSMAHRDMHASPGMFAKGSRVATLRGHSATGLMRS